MWLGEVRTIATASTHDAHIDTRHCEREKRNLKSMLPYRVCKRISAMRSYLFFFLLFFWPHRCADVIRIIICIFNCYFHSSAAMIGYQQSTSIAFQLITTITACFVHSAINHTVKPIIRSHLQLLEKFGIGWLMYFALGSSVCNVSFHSLLLCSCQPKHTSHFSRIRSVSSSFYCHCEFATYCMLVDF